MDCLPWLQRHLILTLVLAILCLDMPCAWPQSRDTGKGVNYETGNGTDQLNCDGGNIAQLHKDMLELERMHLQWVRIETYRTPPSTPTCPKLAEFEGLGNMLKALQEIHARPLVNLGYEYSSRSRASYLAWLNRLLDRFPQLLTFEIGNEENLSNATEGYSGAPRNQWPYGWSFRADDFSPSDTIGSCPTEARKNADLEQAVASYTAWLADTYQTIKRKRQQAVVILGGLSSYQSKRWLLKLGTHRAYQYADAIAYHPYGSDPQSGTKTLDLLTASMKGWPKRLPIWITEFGFTTAAGLQNSVASERLKADELTQQFTQLSARVKGPILYWTARDYPLNALSWKKQCSYVKCLKDPTGHNPGHIPGTQFDASGAGLFQWIGSEPVLEPSFSRFAAINSNRR